MAYSLFPGCSLDASGKAYRTSLDWTLKALGVDVAELPDWNCCGATSTHALNTPFVDAVPARNLAIAEREGRDLLVACSACYHRLQRAHYLLSTDVAARARIAPALGKPLLPTQRVVNLLELLGSPDMLTQIRRAESGVWKGARVGCYYGCLAVRLPGVSGFDDPENPTSMDRIAQAAGAEVIDWPYKTRCCGASLSVTGPEYADRLCADLLQMAERCGLDLLLTSCPFCQYNLDLAQWSSEFGVRSSEFQRANTQTYKHEIPIIFITQYVGMALGASFKEMALGSNLSGVESLKRRLLS